MDVFEETLVMQLFTWLAAAVSSLVLAAPAYAAPLKLYDITLNVARSSVHQAYDCARPLENVNVTFPNLPPSYLPNWGCIDVGDVYEGRIGIDVDRVGTDGRVSLSGGPSLFELEVGNLIIGKGSRPDGVHYSPGFSSSGCQNVFSCFTYEMKAGELKEIFGAAYVYNDFYEIFFYGNGVFAGAGGGASFGGSYTLQAVPEPMSLALVVVALVGVGAARGSRSRMTAKRS